MAVLPGKTRFHGVEKLANKPFILSYRKKSRFVYVRFRDELTGKYGNYISTRTESKAEAARIAYKWLAEGIPGKPAPDDTPHSGARSVLNALRAADLSMLTETERREIVRALQKENVIKSAVISGSRADVRLCDFLLAVWDWESSEYVREKQRAGHRIHKNHVKGFYSFIKKYWIPYFGDKLLGEVTRADLRRFLESLSRFDLSGTTRNQIFQAGATALRFAYSHEYIAEDVAAAKGFTLYAKNTKPRKILSVELMRAVLAVEWPDARSKLAFYISAFTGMRAGEIQALRLQDLGAGRLYVRHSFNYTDGLKEPKNGEARTVYFNAPEVIETLKRMAEDNPHGDFFCFWGMKSGVPMDAKKWLIDFRAALVKTGTMSEQDAREYCFHGQRHFFSANMRALGTPAHILQQQTGHKTLAMLEHYANHETDFDALAITDGQRKLTAAIFPDGAQEIQEGARRIKKINAAEILARLPPPQSLDPLDALEQAGLIRGGVIATDKGLAICAAYLLRYGLACDTRTLAKIRKGNGEEYGTAVAGATIRKTKVGKC